MKNSPEKTSGGGKSAARKAFEAALTAALLLQPTQTHGKGEHTRTRTQQESRDTVVLKRRAEDFVRRHGPESFRQMLERERPLSTAAGQHDAAEHARRTEAEARPLIDQYEIAKGAYLIELARVKKYQNSDRALWMELMHLEDRTRIDDGKVDFDLQWQSAFFVLRKIDIAIQDFDNFVPADKYHSAQNYPARAFSDMERVRDLWKQFMSIKNPRVRDKALAFRSLMTPEMLAPVRANRRDLG